MSGQDDKVSRALRAPAEKLKGNKMRKVTKWLSVCWLCLLFTGCTSFLNPDTGKKEWSVEPNTAAVIESGAEGGVSLLTALSVLWPGLLPIAGIAGGVLGTYKKLKPQLEQGVDYYKGGEVLAQIIEDIKTNNPEWWAKNREKYANLISASADIENAIRGFRNLPPK